MSVDLKSIRIKSGYTVEEVSKILKIRKQYIVDLEEKNFDNIPGQVYVDGYTKMYKELLGIKVVLNNSNNSVLPSLVKTKACTFISFKKIPILLLFLLLLLLFIFFAKSIYYFFLL